jgi:hypothetical protein
MKTYLFTMPLAAGKTEAWKNYLREIEGPRNEEYKKSRERAGIRVEQVYLQQTPHGDSCVVSWECDNPQKVFETFMKSDNPFDQWFREKVLIEAHGMDTSQPLPPMNQHFVDYRETPTNEFAKAGKK